MSDKTPGPDTDSLPLDATGEPIVPDYDNRKDTALYNLEDIQAYERELWDAKQEGREVTMEDPRKRVYGDTVPALVDTGHGGVALAPGVSETHVGVPSQGTQRDHPHINEADVNTDAEPGEVVVDEDLEVVETTEPTEADTQSVPEQHYEPVSNDGE